VIWVGREEEIFLQMGLDGKIKARLICPTGWFRRVFCDTRNEYSPGFLSKEPSSSTGISYR
jgi:hypothetical protein